MRNAILVTSLGIVFGLVTVGWYAGSIEAQDTSPNEPREILVYRPRSTPPGDLAKVLQNLFDISSAAEPQSNTLSMRVDAQTRPKVLEVLEEIDRPPRMLLVQAFLLRPRGEGGQGLSTESLTGPVEKVTGVIRELEDQGKLYIAQRMDMTAIENQPAMLQVGETVALITGSNFTPGGRVNAYREHKLGTILSVTARRSDHGGIALALQFEKSEVQPAKPAGEDAAPPQGTATLSQHTTVHVPDGYAVLAGTLVERSDQRTQEAYLVVSAKILASPTNGLTYRSVSSTEPVARSQAPQRRAPSRSSNAGAAASIPNIERRPDSERYVAYAEALIRRYDTNSDRALNAEERAQVSTDYTPADVNQDGLVTAQELAQWLMDR